MFNPYFTNNYQMNQFSQPMSLTRVTGLDGAKAYQMPPNSTVALFDANNDIMYIKSSDGAGFPTIRTFRFEELTQQPQVPQMDYVTRQEFEELREEIRSYGKQPISAEA